MEKYSVEHQIESRTGTRRELKWMSTSEILQVLKKTSKVHHVSMSDDGPVDENTLVIKIYGHYQDPPVDQNDTYRISLTPFDVNEIV